MKLATLAAICVAALLFLSLGCTGQAGPKIAPSNSTPTPPADIPPPPPDNGSAPPPPAPPGGEAPPPAPV